MNKLHTNRIIGFVLFVLTAIAAAFLPGAVSADHDGPALFFTDAVDAPVEYVVLPEVGDSVVLLIAAHEIGVDNADTVQLKIIHDATIVTVTGIQCVGMYSPALASWSGAIAGIDTGAICSAQYGPLANDGSIIEFTLTRVAAGDANLSLSEVDPLGTTFIEAGKKFRDMEPAVVVDTSAIVDVVSVAPTPTPIPTATSTPVPVPPTATRTPSPGGGGGGGGNQDTPPTEPTDFVAGAGFHSVELNWGAPLETSHFPVTSYVVKNLTTGVAVLVSAKTLSHTFRELDPAIEYSFSVKAITDVGVGLRAQVGPVTPWDLPGPPTSVAANLQANNSSVLVSWDAPDADGGTPVTAYTVTVGTDLSLQTISTEISIPDLLNPGDDILITVFAETAAGMGPSASVSVSRAPEIVPTVAPTPIPTVAPTEIATATPVAGDEAFDSTSVIDTTISGSITEWDELQDSFDGLFGDDVVVIDDPVELESADGHITVELAVEGVVTGDVIDGAIAIQLGNLAINTTDGEGTGSISLGDGLSVEGKVQLTTQDDAIVAEFTNTVLVYAPVPAPASIGDVTHASAGFRVDVNNVADGASLTVTYASSVEELAEVSGAVFELAASSGGTVDPETDIAFVVNVAKSGITNDDLGTNEVMMTVDLAWYETRLAEGKSIVVTKIGDDGVAHTVEAVCELQGAVVRCTAVFAGEAGGFSLFALVAISAFEGVDGGDSGSDSGGAVGTGNTGSGTGGTGADPTATTAAPAPVSTVSGVAPTLAPDELVVETPEGASEDSAAPVATTVAPTVKPVTAPTPTPDLPQVDDSNVLPGMGDADDDGGMPWWLRILIIIVAAPAIIRVVMIFIEMRRRGASATGV